MDIVVHDYESLCQTCAINIVIPINGYLLKTVRKVRWSLFTHEPSERFENIHFLMTLVVRKIIYLNWQENYHSPDIYNPTIVSCSS